jgi:chromosome segregation ATPase
MPETPGAPETLQTLGAKIDALATAMHAGFERVDQRFERVEQRLDKVEQRLDRVEQRLDKVEQRLDKVEQRLDGVEQRLDGVEHRLDGVEQRLDGVEKHFDEFNVKFQVEIEVLGTRLLTAFDGVIAGITDEEANRKAHARFEQQLGDHDLRLIALERGDRKLH